MTTRIRQTVNVEEMFKQIKIESLNSNDSPLPQLYFVLNFI